MRTRTGPAVAARATSRALMLLLAAVLLVSGCAPAVDVLEASDLPTLRTERQQPLRLGGNRPLRISDAGWSGSIADWSRRQPSVTFGTNVCLTRGSDPVTIQDLTAVRTTGHGFKVEGRWIYTPPPGASPIISEDGFGPRVLDGVEPAAGHRFTFTCGGVGLQQLLVGLRGTTRAGGGWQGLRVRYTDSNNEQHVLSVPVEMGMCGWATERCIHAN